MINLALAVACSVAIGMIFKHTGPQAIDRTALLTVNYAVAGGVALLIIALGGRETGGGLGLSAGLLMLGGGVGALLIAGFYLLAYATDVAGMSLAVGVTRVSVVIPFLASWLVWSEVPSVAQGLGMILAAAAFFLIARKHRPPTEGEEGALLDGVDWYAFGVLLLTFCSGGAVDLSMKTFEEGFGAANSRVLFLLLALGPPTAACSFCCWPSGWRSSLALSSWPSAPFGLGTGPRGGPWGGASSSAWPTTAPSNSFCAPLPSCRGRSSFRPTTSPSWW